VLPAKLANKAKPFIVGVYSAPHGREKSRIKPSLRAITNHFSHQHLYEFTEREVNLLLQDYSCQESASNHHKVNSFDGSTQTLNLSEECQLVERYKGIIRTRADFTMLHESELYEIKQKYLSVSVFLKKLKYE